MEIFIRKPHLDLYGGILVKKDTVLSYKNENVEQKLENLVLHSVTRIKGEDYESVYDTTIRLKEGDVLVFEEGGRGYIKPVEPFVTVKEAIEELKCIEDMG